MLPASLPEFARRGTPLRAGRAAREHKLTVYNPAQLVPSPWIRARRFRPRRARRRSPFRVVPTLARRRERATVGFPCEQHDHPCLHDRRKTRARLITEREGFEPSVDRKAHNGFRDRAETAAMPHQNRSLRPGGIQRGMNLTRLRSALTPVDWAITRRCLDRARHPCERAHGSVSGARSSPPGDVTVPARLGVDLDVREPVGRARVVEPPLRASCRERQPCPRSVAKATCSIPSVKPRRHVPGGSTLVGLQDPEAGVERTPPSEESLQRVVAEGEVIGEDQRDVLGNAEGGQTRPSPGAHAFLLRGTVHVVCIRRGRSPVLRMRIGPARRGPGPAEGLIAASAAP